MSDVLPLFDADASRAAADEAIQRADDNAAVIWKREAKATLRDVARAMPEFTADDLWRAGLAKPREPRALGAITRQALSAGIIENTGRQLPSSQVVAHRRPMTVWRSRIFRGER